MNTFIDIVRRLTELKKRNGRRSVKSVATFLLSNRVCYPQQENDKQNNYYCTVCGSSELAALSTLALVL